MTNEKAIKAIRDNYPPSRYSMLREALDMAIDALEKQIPKKPWKQADDDECVYYHYECPRCEQNLGLWKSICCPSCHQLLDWSEND